MSAPVAEESAADQHAGPPWVRWAGAVVWGLVSVVLAVIEVFLLPLATSGGTHIPVASLLAVVGNVLLPRIFVRGLDLRFGWAVPALTWFVVVLLAASQTSDGDLIISGSSYAATTSTVFLALGALSLAFGCATTRMDLRQILRGRRAASRAQDGS